MNEGLGRMRTMQLDWQSALQTLSTGSAPSGRLNIWSVQIALAVLVGQWAGCHLKPLANGSEKVAAPPFTHWCCLLNVI